MRPGRAHPLVCDTVMAPPTPSSVLHAQAILLLTFVSAIVLALIASAPQGLRRVLLVVIFLFGSFLALPALLIWFVRP